MHGVHRHDSLQCFLNQSFCRGVGCIVKEETDDRHLTVLLNLLTIQETGGCAWDRFSYWGPVYSDTQASSRVALMEKGQQFMIATSAISAV